ncbi:MAG: hypothetical protein V4858_17010 [Pseudomonadota bacterium]
MNTPKAAPVAVEAVEREKFEATAIRLLGTGARFELRVDGLYDHTPTYDAYEIWKAARAELASPLVAPVGDAVHVGDSDFETWYSTQTPGYGNLKQLARDAYAAGMGDPLAAATRPQEVVRGEPVTDEQADEIANACYHELLVTTTYNGGMGGQTWDRALVRAALAARTAPVELYTGFIARQAGRINCRKCGALPELSCSRPDCASGKTAYTAPAGTVPTQAPSNAVPVAVGKQDSVHSDGGKCDRVQGPTDAPLLSEDEQRAVLSDLMGLECLLNRHDCWITEADARDMSECVPHHEKRVSELLAMGRAIIAQDPECWHDEQKDAFKLRYSERAAILSTSAVSGGSGS